MPTLHELLFVHMSVQMSVHMSVQSSVHPGLPLQTTPLDLHLVCPHVSACTCEHICLPACLPAQCLSEATIKQVMSLCVRLSPCVCVCLCLSVWVFFCA